VGVKRPEAEQTIPARSDKTTRHPPAFQRTRRLRLPPSESLYDDPIRFLNHVSLASRDKHST